MLAQRQVTQADILQQTQRVVNHRVCSEKNHRVINTQRQHIANRLVLESYCQRFRIKARAIADIAGHFDVRQKTHFDFLHALSFAGLATSALGVERKPARRVTAHARFRHFGIQAADGVPETDIGRRAGARRFADGGLVDLQYPAYCVPARDFFATICFY